MYSPGRGAFVRDARHYGPGAAHEEKGQAGGYGQRGAGGPERELVTLARRLRGLQRTLAEEVHPDLEPAQYALLNHVEEMSPVRMADLVAVLEVDKGPVSRSCARLEELGLLKRSADKQDARATLLSLTAAGKRKLAAARKKRNKWIGDLLSDWSPNQVKTFAGQVSRFNKVFESGSKGS